VTQLEIKRGIGTPKPSDFTDEGGELAIDHQSLTLYSKSTASGAVGKVGLSDFLALDGSSSPTADIDMNGHKITNLGDPVDDGDAVPKGYVDESQDWKRISGSGFTCEIDQRYMSTIIGDNPVINLPTGLGNSDLGKFVVIADGLADWDLPNKSVTVNLGAALLGDGSTQIVLDIKRVIVTFIWEGYGWHVYSSMASVPEGSSSPWTETSQGIEYTGRIDTGEVHTHTLEAEYLLGTPRRHYEAVFGRAVPLDEELDSLEKRSVRHGVEIERIEKYIEQVRAEEANNPVVHEAVYDDTLYGRQNGQWVPILSGGGGTGHDIAAMFFWETRKTFGTEFEGQRWVRFNVAETNAPGYDLMLPDWSLVHQVELQLAWFKGKDPNTGVEYNPRITLQHLNFANEAIKEDVLYQSQEFGWGQGFERDERLFQVRLERGAFKLRVDIKNADGTDMPTSTQWQGTTYKNLIAVNGMFLTTDESQK
jgi:hypothetical protein